MYGIMKWLCDGWELYVSYPYKGWREHKEKVAVLCNCWKYLALKRSLLRACVGLLEHINNDCMVPSAHQHFGNDFMFQQDRIPVHTGGVVNTLLEETGVNFL